METTRLSLLSLLPFLLLAIAAEATGGELSTFIVHVQAEENHVFGTADDRKAWYHSFLPEHGRLVHAYHHVASGFAARLTRRELEAVSAMPGFLSATRARTYTTLTTHTPEFLGLNLEEQGRRNYTSEFGAGVIVAVIDTGIFPDHPSFSDDGMPPPPAKWKGRCDFSGTSCNNKLIGARNMVAALNGPNGTSARVPPVDEFGHGTHTASTAAGAVVPGANVLGHAWGTAAGMAVRAHIAIYKVCYGKVVVDCEDADILAGIDAAVGDCCDVISMSLGGPSVPFHLNPMAIGTFGAMEKGIFVSMAAGNSGPGESTVINEAPWMLTVAASTMDRSIRSTVQLGNGAYFHGESLYQPNVGFCPLVYAGASGKPFAEFCGNGSLDGFDVKGKIVLCELTKNISVINQGEVVESAGGVAMILASPFFRGYDKLAQANILPASSVDYLVAAAIKSYLNSTANPVARMGFRGTLLGTSPAPSIIFFSSRGPSRQGTGVLKPDITGPGMNVLAAWPFQVGPPSAPVLPGPTFNIISGTSMSTPHLAGIAALIKSKHPDCFLEFDCARRRQAQGEKRRGGAFGVLRGDRHAEQHRKRGRISEGPGIHQAKPGTDFLGIRVAEAECCEGATGTKAGGSRSDDNVNAMKAADPGLVYDITPENYIGYLCSMYTSHFLEFDCAIGGKAQGEERR
uniref:Subtilisin-like protease n=1 Tax=Aegilops tauschii TaxID=37682 RepID=M8C6V3_AEGTA